MYFKSFSLISCFSNVNHPRNIWLLCSRLLTLSWFITSGFTASRAWDKILVQVVNWEVITRSRSMCVARMGQDRVKSHKWWCPMKFIVVVCRSCFFPHLRKLQNEIYKYLPEILVAGIFIYWLLHPIWGLPLETLSSTGVLSLVGFKCVVGVYFVPGAR